MAWEDLNKRLNGAAPPTALAPQQAQPVIEEPPKSAYEKLSGWGKIHEDIKAEEPAQTNILGGVADIGKLLYDVPVQTAGAVGALFEEEDPFEKVDWKDTVRNAARQRLNLRQQELLPSERRERLIPGTDFLTRGDIQEASASTGFSAATLGSQLAASLPLILAPVPGARPAGIAAGMAAGATTAFRIDKNTLTVELLEQAEAAKGSPLSKEERKTLLDETEDIRNNHALWEAGPEAIGNALSLTGIGSIFKGAAKAAVPKMITGLVTALGGELGTETVTQMGQQRAEAELGLTDQPPRSWTELSDWAESFQEIAPQTILLTGLMGGGGAISGAVSKTVNESKSASELAQKMTQKEQAYTEFKQSNPTDQELDQLRNNPAKIEERGLFPEHVEGLIKKREENAAFLKKTDELAAAGKLTDPVRIKRAETIRAEMAERTVKQEEAQRAEQQEAVQREEAERRVSLEEQKDKLADYTLSDLEDISPPELERLGITEEAAREAFQERKGSLDDARSFIERAKTDRALQRDTEAIAEAKSIIDQEKAREESRFERLEQLGFSKEDIAKAKADVVAANKRLGRREPTQAQFEKEVERRVTEEEYLGYEPEAPGEEIAPGARPVTEETSLLAKGERAAGEFGALAEKIDRAKFPASLPAMVSAGRLKKIQEAEETFSNLIPDKIRPAINVMEMEMKEGEVGQRFKKQDGTWGGVKTTNPKWIQVATLKKYDEAHGTQLQNIINKKNVSKIISKVKADGVTALTDRQRDAWDYISKSAEDLKETHPTLIAADTFERADKQGIDISEPRDITVGETDPGDTMLITNKEGIPEIFTHEGFDAKGSAIFRGETGQEIVNDPFEKIQVIGIKKGEGRELTEKVNSDITKIIPRIANVDDARWFKSEIEKSLQKSPELAQYAELYRTAIDKQLSGLQGEERTKLKEALGTQVARREDLDQIIQAVQAQAEERRVAGEEEREGRVARVRGERKAPGRPVSVREEGGREVETGGVLQEAPREAPEGPSEVKFSKEEGRDLIATHNISAKNLIAADNAGGLAVPSIGITKVAAPVTGYGEISLIGDSDIISPEKDARSRIFGADVYSPVYPEVESIISNPEALSKEINSIISLKIKENSNIETLKDSDVVDEYSEGGPFAIARKLTPVKLAYLVDNNINIDTAGLSFNEANSEIQNKISPHRDKIEAWLLKKMEAVGIKYSDKIFAGYDKNRKKEYLPHNLANVVKLMSRKIKNEAEGFNYGLEKIIAGRAQEFKTIAQLKKQKDRLTSREDVSKIRAEIDGELELLLEDMKPYYIAEKGKYGYKADTVESLSKGISDVESNFKKMPVSLSNKVKSFLGKLNNIPVEYFEAKPQRAVGIGEFSGAVVPRGTPRTVIDLLNKNGITDIRYYAKGDSKSRAEAIQKFRSLLFSKKTGVRAEGVTADSIKKEISETIGAEQLSSLVNSGRLTISEESPADGTTKAVIYGNGNIVMYSKNISRGKAINVLAHELGVHYGYENIFGDKSQGIFKRFAAFRDQGGKVGQAVNKAYMDVPADTPKNIIDEEALAYFVENKDNYNLPLHRQIIAAIKAWLVKTLGVTPKILNTDDMVAIAVSALRRGDGKAAVKPGVEKLSKAEFKPVTAATVETPLFKRWFGNSKILSPNGKPAIVYHGSPQLFTDFSLQKVGKNTGSPMTNLGLFFASDRNEALGYTRGTGNVGNFFLRMEKPFVVESIAEVPTQTVEQVKNFRKYLISLGYDGIVVKDEGHLISFSPRFVKSAELGTGEFDITKTDVRYSKNSTTNEVDNLFPEMEDINEEFYKKNRQTFRSPLRTALRETSRFAREAREGVDKYLGSISTRLGKVDTELKTRIRKLDFDIARYTREANVIANNLFQKTKKMSKADLADWDLARKNRDTSKINDLVKKYGIKKEYDAVNEMIESTRNRAYEAGLEISKIDDYWPRVLKDKKGFLEHLQRGNDWPAFSQQIRAKEEEMGLDPGTMPIEEQANIVNNLLLGHGMELSRPTHAKARKISVVSPELNKYYMTSDGALVSYIFEMNKNIEARNFFGKVPARVREIRTQLNAVNKKINAAQKEAGSTDVSRDALRLDEINKKVSRYLSTKIKLENYLEQFYLTREDHEASIGQFLVESMASGKLKPGDESTVREILMARFSAKGTHGIIGLYKNMSYIDTMGSVTSAITQIGDLAFSLYAGGLKGTAKGFINAARGKSMITREDLGLENIAQEFEDSGTSAKWVTTVFKATGLEKMDAIGKETLVNATMEKAMATAADDTKNAKLKAELREIFGDQSGQVLKDLKNKDITEDVLFYAWNKLADFQPISLAEYPQKYLDAGNGRLFYMLKSYTLKMFDVYRRESIGKIIEGTRTKNASLVKEGTINMVKLAALLVIANATADELKDFLLGRETDIQDTVVDNVLRLFGVGKYVVWRARYEGAGSAFVKQVAPPFKFFDALTKDISHAGDQRGLETIGSIPLVGKIYYWRWGRGSGKRGDLIERRFAEKKRRARELKEEYEQAKDKTRFSYKHQRALTEARQIDRASAKITALSKRYNLIMSQNIVERQKEILLNNISRQKTQIMEAMLR